MQFQVLLIHFLSLKSLLSLGTIKSIKNRSLQEKVTVQDILEIVERRRHHRRQTRSSPKRWGRLIPPSLKILGTPKRWVIKYRLASALSRRRHQFDSRVLKKCTKHERRQLENDFASISHDIQCERDKITEVKCNFSSALRQRQCLLALRSPDHSKRRRLTKWGNKCGRCTRWHHLDGCLASSYPLSGASRKRLGALWRRQPDAHGGRILSCFLSCFRWFSVVPATHQTLSRPPKRKRSIMVPKTISTSLLSTMKLCSNRMAGRTTGLVMDFGDDVLHTEPCFEDYALPHTVFRWIWLAVTFLSISWTFSPSAGIFHDHQEWVIVRDVKKKFSHVALDYDTELSDEHYFSSLRRTFPLHMSFFSQFCWNSSQWSPRHFFPTSWSVTLTSAWFRTLLSCCQVAPPCSKKLVSAWRWNRRSCLHPRRRSRWLLHQRDSIRCGHEGLSCFLFFSRCRSRGRVRWIWPDQDQIDCGTSRRSVPHALRRIHHHSRWWTFPLREYFSNNVLVGQASQRVELLSNCLRLQREAWINPDRLHRHFDIGFFFVELFTMYFRPSPAIVSKKRKLVGEILSPIGAYPLKTPLHWRNELICQSLPFNFWDEKNSEFFSCVLLRIKQCFLCILVSCLRIFADIFVDQIHFCGVVRNVLYSSLVSFLSFTSKGKVRLCQKWVAWCCCWLCHFCFNVTLGAGLGVESRSPFWAHGQCSLWALWPRSWLQMIPFARIAILDPTLSSILPNTQQLGFVPN